MSFIFSENISDASPFILHVLSSDKTMDQQSSTVSENLLI